jgi:aromatic ring hydroxylase
MKDHAMAMIQTLCARFVTRSEYFGLKGKKRDIEAFQFMVGAASALEAIGHPEAEHVKTCVQFIISFRGYAEVARIAAQEEAAAA